MTRLEIAQYLVRLECALSHRGIHISDIIDETSPSRLAQEICPDFDPYEYTFQHLKEKYSRV